MHGRSGSETRQMTEMARVRFTPADWAVIAVRANEAGISISRFLRDAALNRRIRAQVDKEALRALGKATGLLKTYLSHTRDAVGATQARQILSLIHHSLVDLRR